MSEKLLAVRTKQLDEVKGKYHTLLEIARNHIKYGGSDTALINHLNGCGIGNFKIKGGYERTKQIIERNLSRS